MPDPTFSPPLAAGDRVAFLTLGLPPRTLCGVVVTAAVRDPHGPPRIRIRANGRTYLACARWVRRIP